MKVNENGYPFCNEFNGHKELSYFELTYGARFKIDDRRLFETNLFACVPSIGSFVEGYLLVIPKKHFLASLLMPQEYLQELQMISNVLDKYYNNCYRTGFVVYEHGAANEENVGGMSVVHAHVHFVPCNSEVIKFCPEFEFIKFGSLIDASEYYSKYGNDRPYLLFRDIDTTYYLAFSNNIPSQFFRKRVCDIIGQTGKGDWEVYPFIDNIKKTLNTAHKHELQKMF